MNNILLDSCILIDYSKGKPEAFEWVDALQRPPMISTLTMTEVIAGIRNKREKELFARLFSIWQIIEVTPEIASLGGDYLQQYRKNHGTDLVDAIIAATARHQKAELVTLNVKHFPMIKGLKAPY